jgi:hypothetical protein
MTVYPSSVVLMLSHVGKASVPTPGTDAVSYALFQAMTGEMIVESPVTKKKVCFTWQDLLQLAVAAGIDIADDPDDPVGEVVYQVNLEKSPDAQSG